MDAQLYVVLILGGILLVPHATWLPNHALFHALHVGAPRTRYPLIITIKGLIVGIDRKKALAAAARWPY